MQATPSLPPPPDIDHQLELEILREAADTLRHMLPPPIDDTPEARLLRDHVAIAKVAAMDPGNPVEADLAACHVAAIAHYKDCLRQVAEQNTVDPKRADQLRAQCASMQRQASGFLGRFERMLAIRKKREDDPVARESADRAEHYRLALLTQALESLPPQPPPAPAAPKPAAGSPPVVRWRDYDDWTDEEKRVDRLHAKASRYAILNPVRVALIRKLGGLPPDCDYEPPDDELLHEIIHGTHPNLIWAETYVPWVHPDLRSQAEPPS
jgi:hypothetical protein